MKTTTMQELQDAARQLNDIREQIRDEISTLNPVELVTPKNLVEEKKVWIENAKIGRFKNPNFVYDEEKCKEAISHEKRLIELKKQLQEIVPIDDEGKVDKGKLFVWRLLIDAIHSGLDTVDMARAILNHDDDALGDAVLSKYGLSCGEIVKVAEDMADEIKERGVFAKEYNGRAFEIDEEDRDLLANADFNAEEIKYFFDWAMKQYSPKNAWPIEIVEECSAIDVRDKSSFGHPVIVIPADRKVNGFKLAELIGHEIECHWRGSINAELIGSLKGDSEVVYEGIAKLKDNEFNRYFMGEDVDPLPYYILAEQRALEGDSFKEAAKFIFGLLPRGEKKPYTKAWNYTYRAFRGISNPENLDGYAFTKDRAYLEGFLYAKELKKRGMSSFLSFSTLDRANLTRLMNLLDIEDMERVMLPDLNIQLKAIEKMLKYLKASDDGVGEFDIEDDDEEEPQDTIKALYAAVARSNALDPHDFGPGFN